MPVIEYPLGLEGVEQLPRTKRTLQNCFNNGNGIIIHRPGIKSLQDTGRTARGSFQWNGSLYQVVSTDLIKITNTETGAFITIGTILGAAVIRTAIGFNTAVIVVKGGNIYTLDTADALVIISTGTNFNPCVDVAHINGRFVYIPIENALPPGHTTPFFSNIGDAATVGDLSFFDAESLPDQSNGVINYRNTLYIFGTDSIEPFRDQGLSPVPFIRINGGRIDNGFIGGLFEYNQTFVFLGREKDQDFGIYAFTNGVAVKISNETIDLILSEHTEAEREDAVTSRFKWRGYDIFTVTLLKDSFAFFGGNWFRLRSLIDGDDTVWAGGFITQLDGEYFTAFRTKMGKLENIDTDNGERITFLIEMGLEQEDGNKFTCQSIELPISQGFNTQDASVGLQMSKDGVDYGQPFFRNLGGIADYQRVLKWNFPGGLGRFRGFMGWRFFTSELVKFSAEPPIVKLRRKS